MTRRDGCGTVLAGLLAMAGTPAVSRGQEARVEATGAPVLERGVFPTGWADLATDCGRRPWRIHEYNPTFFIIRQSGCTHYEKPFLYHTAGDGALQARPGTRVVGATVSAARSSSGSRTGRWAPPRTT